MVRYGGRQMIGNKMSSNQVYFMKVYYIELFIHIRFHSCVMLVQHVPSVKSHQGITLLYKCLVHSWPANLCRQPLLYLSTMVLLLTSLIYSHSLQGPPKLFPLQVTHKSCSLSQVTHPLCFHLPSPNP